MDFRHLGEKRDTIILFPDRRSVSAMIMSFEVSGVVTSTMYRRLSSRGTRAGSWRPPIIRGAGHGLRSRFYSASSVFSDFGSASFFRFRSCFPRPFADARYFPGGGRRRAAPGRPPPPRANGTEKIGVKRTHGESAQGGQTRMAGNGRDQQPRQAGDDPDWPAGGEQNAQVVATPLPPLESSQIRLWPRTAAIPAIRAAKRHS